MKTFIFALLVIGGFFYYLFVENASKTENIQKETLQDIESAMVEKEKEVQEYTSLTKEAPTAIPEDQTFDTIKKILQEVSGRTYNSDITLNTRVNSYLYTQEKKDQFKLSISSAFNIDYGKVEEMYEKNKLVWDWVNTIKE